MGKWHSSSHLSVKSTGITKETVSSQEIFGWRRSGKVWGKKRGFRPSRVARAAPRCSREEHPNQTWTAVWKQFVKQNQWPTSPCTHPARQVPAASLPSPLSVSIICQAGDQECEHLHLPAHEPGVRVSCCDIPVTYLCLPGPLPPALLPAAEPNQSTLLTGRALAAGRISRESFVALDLNEIHFQNSPGSHCSFQAERDHLRTLKGKEEVLH